MYRHILAVYTRYTPNPDGEGHLITAANFLYQTHTLFIQTHITMLMKCIAKIYTISQNLSQKLRHHCEK